MSINNAQQCLRFWEMMEQMFKLWLLFHNLFGFFCDMWPFVYTWQEIEDQEDRGYGLLNVGTQKSHLDYSSWNEPKMWTVINLFKCYKSVRKRVECCKWKRTTDFLFQLFFSLIFKKYYQLFVIWNVIKTGVLSLRVLENFKLLVVGRESDFSEDMCPSVHT